MSADLMPGTPHDLPHDRPYHPPHDVGERSGEEARPRRAGGVRERVVRFGPGEHLAGILTVPRVPRAGVPPVVLVNAGIVHRVGPTRLYVDLARALGAIGFTVLRFDLTGLGDSSLAAEWHEPATPGASGTGMSISASAVADVQAAFAFLADARQAEGFVVCGLCSGANHALLAAFTDARVRGLLLVDPTVRRTRRSRLVHLGRRLRHGPTWRALLTLTHPSLRGPMARVRAALGLAERDTGAHAPSSLAAYAAGAPPEREVRAGLERLLVAGVRFFLVFTGGVNHIYNYREQLFDLLPGLDWRGLLRLEYMADTDHTVSDGPSRAALLAAAVEWASMAFPARPAESEEGDA